MTLAYTTSLSSREKSVRSVDIGTEQYLLVTIVALDPVHVEVEA